jgi:hypothetical protein
MGWFDSNDHPLSSIDRHQSALRVAIKVSRALDVLSFLGES